MLSALHIQDFVLIDQARLALAPGLTALTGETGAGKSILLDALGLAVGGRSERGAVRHGAKQGVVTAIFDVASNHPVWGVLAENALDSGEDQVILRRVQSADGRGRGFVNDQPVSVRMLRMIGETLIEIHGQHDGRGLLTASTHRDMLDEFGGLGKSAAAVVRAWQHWRALSGELEEKKRERDATAREADYLAHVFEVLDRLAPEAGEETALAERRAALMASEKINEDLKAAIAAFDEGGIESKLSIASRNVERACARLKSGNTVLASAASHLDSALAEAGEAYATLAAALREFGGDVNELDETEERLFTLRAEARKHGVVPDELHAFTARTKEALDSLSMGAAAFEKLDEDVAAAKATYHKLALSLSKKRHATAKKLDSAVAKELAPLKLGKAVFSTQITSDPENPGTDGIDNVEFMVATNPGAPAGPLKSIASGGELSRFVLAMKAALAAKENRTVIIFDEVDAGVGGAVADAVGERLSRLAGDAQVLVVTHSPQVAARAQNHWRIEKTQTKKQTTTRVMALDDSERTEEIARMLSGATVTKEARAAARTLLGHGETKKPSRRNLAKAG